MWEMARGREMNNGEKILEILQQMQTDIAGLQTQFNGMQETVSSIQLTVGGLQADVAGLKADVAGVKADVAGVKTDIGRLESKMEEGFRATRSEIMDVVEEVGCQVRQMSGSFQAVKDAATQNAFDIQSLRAGELRRRT